MSLIKNSPDFNDNKTCGVYSVPCKVCSKKYIGQTGKSLDERLKQHKYSVRTASNSSALFVHVQEFNHNINWKEAKMLYQSSSLAERLIIESSLIKTCDVMNLHDGMYKIDNILMKSLWNTCKSKRALEFCNN